MRPHRHLSSASLLPRAVIALAVMAAACTATAGSEVPLEDRTAVPAVATEQPAILPSESLGAPVDQSAATTTAPGDDLRVEALSPAADGDTFALDILDGDGSFLLTVEASSPEHLVGIRKVTDPTGDIRYFADLRQEVLLIDDLHPRLLADAGAVGLYVASTPAAPLAVGTWQIELAANDGIARAEAVVRRSPGDAPQQMDVAVWVTDADLDPALIEPAWRPQIDAALGPHGISVGSLTAVAAAGEDLRRFATIGVEGLASEVHAACESAAAAVGSTTRRQVVVIVADTISDALLTAHAGGPPHPHAAVFRPDGAVDGFAVSTPGTPVLGPDSHACVAVSAASASISARSVLHEVLHVAGLTWHTSERDGRRFDPFDDTPRCELGDADRDLDLQVSTDECADGDNLMFWTGDGLELSAEQAWHVRQHPLLRSS